MIAPIDKIKSLLNEDIISLFGDDVINNAYTEAFKSTIGIIEDEHIMDSLANSSLERAQYLIQHDTDSDGDAVYNDSGFSKNRRILSVLRKNTLGTDYDNVYYEASKLPHTIGTTQANNPKSIYYENDRWNPKYYFNDTGGMVILPKNYTGGINPVLPRSKIIFITFPDFASAPEGDFRYTFELNGLNFSGVSKENESVLFYGIPGGAKELLYIQMCLNLVQNYVADFVYDEEDTELLALAKDHAAALMAKKQEELNIVLAKYSNKKAE